MVSTSKSKLAHPAASSLARKPALLPEWSGWAYPLSRRCCAPIFWCRSPRGCNLLIALVFMAAALVQQSFAATSVEQLTESRTISVRYGTRKRLDANSHEETVTMRDSDPADRGDSFVENKFAYWTSKCPKDGHTFQEHFLKASLDAHTETWHPALKLNYEFREDVLIKNVFLLFNIEMMSGDDFKSILDSKVHIRSLQDKSKESSGKEMVEVKVFDSQQVGIGSGFFPTGFTQKAKYLEINILNTEITNTKDIILDAVHLYDELNYLPSIPFGQIKLTNVQEQGPFQPSLATGYLTDNAVPWITQAMPRASWISSFDEAKRSDQCLQIEPRKDLQLDFGEKMTVKDVLVVTEVVSLQDELSVQWMDGVHNPRLCEAGYQGAFYGDQLKISYKTSTGELYFTEKETMKGSLTDKAGITVNDFTTEDANNDKQDIGIQFLQFSNQSETKPVRICHLGVFATAIDQFAYTIPTIGTMIVPDDKTPLNYNAPISFSRGYDDLSTDCQVDIADAVNDGLAVEDQVAVSCEKRDNGLQLTISVPINYDWGRFSRFKANQMTSFDFSVKFKAQGQSDYTNTAPISIQITKNDAATETRVSPIDATLGWTTQSEQIDAPVWTTEPTDVTILVREEFSQTPASGLATNSELARSIISTPTRDPVLNSITFDVNLEPQADLTFAVGDVLSFTLVFTYTDKAAGDTSTLTQSFDINVKAQETDVDVLEEIRDPIISEGGSLEELSEQISISSEIDINTESDDIEPKQWVIDDDYIASLNPAQQEELKDKIEDYLEESDPSDISQEDEERDPSDRDQEKGGKLHEGTYEGPDENDRSQDIKDQDGEDDDDDDDKEADPAYIDPQFFDFLAKIRPQRPSEDDEYDDTQDFDQFENEFVEEIEKIVIVPKITEVNPIGELKIAFDPPYAKVPNSWNAIWDPVKKAAMTAEELTFIDSMITEVFQVIFIQNSEETPQGYFDQSVASFSPSGMTVNLNFSDPLLISQGEVPDKVTVRLLKSFFTKVDESYYQQQQGSPQKRQLQTDTNVSADSESPFHIFEFDVPKQVKSKDELDSLQSSGDAAQQLIGTQFVTFAILHIVMRGAMSQMWNIFNTMQLLTAIPLFGINTPSNVLFLNEEINKISNFEIIKKEQLYDWVIVPIFNTSTSEQKAIEAGVIVEAKDADIDQLEKDAEAAKKLAAEVEIDEEVELQEEIEDESYLDKAFKGTNLVMAILFVSMTMILFVLMMLLVVLCRRFIMARGCKCLQTILIKIEAKLMFNSVLRAILMSYFLFSIVSMKAFYKISFESTEGLINLIVAILLVSSLTIFPFAQHKFLLKNQDKLKSLRYIDKYGSLYQNVNVEKRHALRFTLYFCLRRLIFAFAIIVLKDSVIIQILVTDLTVVGMLSFYLAGKPMIDGPNNFIQIFNECIICLVIVSMVVFTNFIPSPIDRYNYGWYLLYFIGASVCVNMVILAVNITKIVYMAIKKKMMKKKLSKHIEAAEKKRIELLNQLEKVKLQVDKVKKQKQSLRAINGLEQILEDREGEKDEDDESSSSEYESSSSRSDQSGSSIESSESQSEQSESDSSQKLSVRSLSDAVVSPNVPTYQQTIDMHQQMNPVRPRRNQHNQVDQSDSIVATRKTGKGIYAADDQEMQMTQIILTGLNDQSKTQFVPGTTQQSVLDDPSMVAIINENDLLGIDEKLARQEGYHTSTSYSGISRGVNHSSASKLLQAQQNSDVEVFEDNQEMEKRQSRRAMLNQMLAKAKAKTRLENIQPGSRN